MKGRVSSDGVETASQTKSFGLVFGVEYVRQLLLKHYAESSLEVETLKADSPII